MAKNFRRMFAMVLVMCMIFSALPMQALAAEEDAPFTETDTVSGGEVVITITPSESNSNESSVVVSGTNESGSSVNLTGTSTTTSSSTTDSAGNVTESSSTHVELEGTEIPADGSAKDGIHVDYEDTTTSTTVTDEDGNVVSEKEVTEGFETKEWDEEDSGNEADQPKVDVVLKPGETTTGTATTTETTGDVQKSENDTQYNYTETTTTDRTVTAETSDITVTEAEVNDFTMESLEPVKKPEAVDLTWDGTFPMDSSYFDTVTFKTEAGDEVRYVPRFERTEEQMCPELLKFYDKKETDGVITYVPKEISGKTTTNASGRGQFVLFDIVENSPYTILFEDKSTETGCTIGAVDEFGNLLVTYCMDHVTSTSCGYSYIMENLDDADYFEGTEEEQQAAKDQVRAIALKGYWGTTEGMGSLSQIKTDLKAFIENNPDFTFTYSDPATINGGEAKTENREFNAGMDKEYLLQLIDKLNEAGAISVTQSAIWEHGRGKSNPEIVYKNSALENDHEFNYALAMFREYLLSPAIQEEDNLKETIIYDQDSFLVEDSLKLTVGDKVEGSQWNEDESDSNDEYNVDLSFKLVVAPGEDDDLVVCLVDSNNTIVRKARIAGDVLEGEKSDEILIGEDGSYTFTNVPLQENSDIAFNLKLEGIQYLEKGVYIYKSVRDNGTADYGYKQTLVGVAQGSHEVDVTTAFTVNFSVDENNHVVSKTVWHNESDPSTKPSEHEDPTPASYQDGDAPVPQVFRLNNQDNLVEIPEEPVPLATPVVTGDNSNLWIAVILMSVLCMVAINVFDKKKQHETF